MTEYPQITPQGPDETDLAYAERQREAIRQWRGWPPHVEPLGIMRLDLLGVDPKTNQLYWDGQPVVMKHQLGRREFFLAALAAWSTAGAALIAAAAFAYDILK